MKLAIAGDHYTVDVLKKVEQFLSGKGIDFENVGTMNPDKKISLQEIIPNVTRAIQSGEATNGILVCGTGAGVEIGANGSPRVNPWCRRPHASLGAPCS